MKPVRVFIYDDHPKVLAQIVDRLAYEGDFEIVGKTSDKRLALNLAKKFTNSNSPNVLLIDPVQEAGVETDVICEFKEMFPSIAVVVLTVFVDAMLQMDLRKLGVKHILEKSIASDQLVEMLRSVSVDWSVS